MIPQPDNYSAGLTSTVQKMNNIDKSSINDNSDSAIKISQIDKLEGVDLKISNHDKEEQQMTANDFEISNRSSARGFNE